MINFKLQSIPQQLFRIHNHVHYIYEVRQSAIAERSRPGGPRDFYFHKIMKKVCHVTVFYTVFCQPAITAFGRSMQCGVDKCWVNKARLTALTTLVSCQLKKPFKGPRQGSCWKEGTRENNLLSDELSFDCAHCKSMIFLLSDFKNSTACDLPDCSYICRNQAVGTKIAGTES